MGPHHVTPWMLRSGCHEQRRVGLWLEELNSSKIRVLRSFPFCHAESFTQIIRLNRMG